jgi:hypothetical protein
MQRAIERLFVSTCEITPAIKRFADLRLFRSLSTHIVLKRFVIQTSLCLNNDHGDTYADSGDGVSDSPSTANRGHRRVRMVRGRAVDL